MNEYSTNIKKRSSEMYRFLFPDKRDRKRLFSRVHTLNSFDNLSIKRDDELSFGISGSKLRKLLFISNYMKKIGCSHLYIEGAYLSNNTLSSAQHFTECGIPHSFVVKKEPHKRDIGNGVYLSLFNPDIVKSKPTLLDNNEFFLPEGCMTLEGVLGSMSLLFDIIENNEIYDVIALDVGSGTTALGLLFAKQLLDLNIEIDLYSSYDKKDTFLEKYKSFRDEMNSYFKINFDESPSFFFSRYKEGACFGSMTKGIEQTISSFAQKEGAILDPLYSGKMIHTLSSSRIKEKTLVIHGGGALALSGYI